MSHLILPPMKAPNEIVPFNSPFIRWPMFESRKFDGFRCLMLSNGDLVSPNGKPFANKLLWEHLYHINSYAVMNKTIFDGEIFSEKHTFQELQSILRSYDKEIPKGVKYYVFDSLREDEWLGHSPIPIFEKRYYRYLNQLNSSAFENVEPVIQTKYFDPEVCEAYFRSRIDNGQEGLMLRHPDSLYKHGRCTHNQGWMFKFKEFETQDAVIDSVITQMKMKEGVDRTFDEFGHLERLHKTDDFELDRKIAGFRVWWNGQLFGVKAGKGFTNQDKEEWYKINEENGFIIFRGRHIEFKYMPHGTKSKPRIGTLTRFRPDLD